MGSYLQEKLFEGMGMARLGQRGKRGPELSPEVPHRLKEGAKNILN